MVDSLNNLSKLTGLSTGGGSGGGLGGLGKVAGGGPLDSTGMAGAADAGAAPSFKDVLMKNLNDVNKLQQDADSTLENFVTGKTNNVGEVISASQKANLAFSMLVQIRNKLQDAYDEIKDLRV